MTKPPSSRALSAHGALLATCAVLSLLLQIRPCRAQRERRVQDPTLVVYKPAAGYFICPEEGLVCTIINCYDEFGCDDFMFNFDHVPDVLHKPEETVYVSMGHSSITLGPGDAEMIVCDSRCSCQSLIADGDGCRVRPPTEMPSSAPSYSVAPTISSSPSFRPSAMPTSSPSDFPSLSPTQSPSSAPSLSPTSSPTISSPIQIMLRDISGDKVYDSQSPQYHATLWMSQHDNFDFDIFTEEAKLKQRYALVALDFAFHENDGSKLEWSDPDTDECTWDGVTCMSFSGVNHVREINWARRKLSGTVVPEINLLPALETLDLATNEIGGTLDPFYPLNFLKNLYLFENRFTGTISSDIGNLDILERLYIGKNELSGTFPEGLWNPERDRPLQWLVMHHNNFEGPLPMGMRFGHLRYFDISNNSFNSTIPTDWPDTLLTMRTLYIDNNELRGEIPSNFAEIGKGWLKQFYANDNKLTGRFPSGWGENGIPRWYLTNVDIRNNRFTRDMPSSVCRMSVFDEAEMVELRADCDEICDCPRRLKLCDNCN